MPEFQTSTEEFFLKGDRIGVLLVHGFSSSPTEMRGLGDYLHAHGYTVLAVRLAGHGTKPNDMRRTKLADWMRSAREGAQQLFASCDQVFAVGQSMGGLICLKLSLEFPFHGVAVLSPPMFKPDWRWRILPIAQYFVRWYTIGGGTDPSAYEPPYTVRAYPKAPTNSLREFLKLVAEVRKSAPKVTAPVLIMQGDKDRIIPFSSHKELMSILGSKIKRSHYLSNSGHVMTVDAERNLVWHTICNFMDRLKEKNS